MVDHFHNFHTRIQILANLNESMVNSHFPDDYWDGAHKRRRRRPVCPTASSEISATPVEKDAFEEKERRGPPTTLPSFPLELLELVFRHLSKAELFLVLQANKALHSVAERLLYRDLAIASSDSNPTCAVVSFLKHLLSNASVHRHVRKLDINVTTIQSPTANFYRLLQRLLQGTTRLCVLELDLPKSHSPVWILDGCSFKLLRFSTSMHCTPALAQFLDTQEGITHLTLRGFHHDALKCLPFIHSGGQSPHGEEALPPDQFTLKETSLPRLACFNAIHAGPSVVREVVRGRPVTNASIPLFHLHSLGSLDAVQTSVGSMRRLTVISFDPDAPNFIFDQLVRRFPHLEALHIVILLAEFTTDQLLEGCRYLRNFTRLKYITCIAMSSEELSVTEEQNIAERWHEACPALRTIILPKGRVWFNKPARVCASPRNEDDESSTATSAGNRGIWECLEG